MSRVIICATGIVTPLGLNTAQTAASVRAGLSAFQETNIMDKNFSPFVMALLPDEELPELKSDAAIEGSLTYREARMLKLAYLASDQIKIDIPKSESVSFFVGISDFEGNLPIDLDRFARQLGSNCFNSVPKADVLVMPFGRAAGLVAVDKAIEALTARECDIAVAGGVDTFCDFLLLGTLDMEGRVATEATFDGFTPGEGSAFLMLTTEETAERLELKHLGVIDGCATGEEVGHMYCEEPYRGDGLAETVSSLFEHVAQPNSKIPTIFSSMNGENYFAKEWGVTFMRNSEFISDEFRIEHPADCIGDSGAASGPIMIGLAISGLQKGYLPGPVLVYSSSDKATRAACLVEQT